MSKIEVNAIEPQCGTTLTVGASGDTITFPTGTTIVNNGSQSGFGRTGTVDWDTAIKTSTITAVNGEGYFVNTSGGAITANLPAGVVGAIVSFKDYAQTFDTNALTISANASEKIEGQTFDLTLDTEGIATTLVYGDATKGWQSVNSNEVVNSAKFISASGGTETTSGNFKIHTFTGPGTLCVSCAGNAGGSNSVSYMIVAGGGGGGGDYGGGGGAGGYREGKASSDCYSASPLNAPAGLPVSVQGYSVTVGGGGPGGQNPGTSGTSGSNSVFSTITSTGGGHGGTLNAPSSPASTGGSGGGGTVLGGGTGAAGNTPPVSPSQGNPGGNGSGAMYAAGGGGGAGAAGTNGIPGTPATAGPGGAGTTSSINATPTARAGGGGGGGGGATVGGNQPYTSSTGGSGGGGAGALDSPSGNGVAGTTNTGGGGGGGNLQNPSSNGGTGGSGIVIIRYKFQ